MVCLARDLDVLDGERRARIQALQNLGWRQIRIRLRKRVGDDLHERLDQLEVRRVMRAATAKVVPVELTLELRDELHLALAQQAGHCHALALE